MAFGENIESRENNETGKIPLEERISALEKQVSRDYSISLLKVGELVKILAEEGRNELIAELEKEIIEPSENMSEKIDYNSLADKIAEISILRQQTRESIAGLRIEMPSGKNELNDPKTFLVSRFFKPETLIRIQDPQNVKDQLAGLGIGTLESIATVGKFVVDIPLGFIKSPVDGVNIANGDGEYDGFKKV